MAKTVSAAVKKIEVSNLSNLNPRPNSMGRRGTVTWCENEVWGGYGNERAPWSLSTQIKGRTFNESKKMMLNLTDEKEKQQHNAVKKSQKAMIQFALSFSNILLWNKLNCKKTQG
jgi:hypothetical protein